MKSAKYSLLLALLIAVQTLSACASETPTNDDTSAPDSTFDVQNDDDGFVKDDLPQLDFDGETVNVLVGDYSNAYWNDFYAEDETGNRINDVLYSMRLSINERLNIDLQFHQYTYAWAQTSEYANYVIQMIMSGSDDYDISVGKNFVEQQAESEYFYSLSDNKYIDLDKPWWNSTILDAMPSDSVHFATGDGTLAAIKHTLCMFFNQDMLDAYGVEDDIYELVESGKWTLDKLEGYTKLFYSDLNGNTQKDFSDSYGLTFGDLNKYIGFINSFDIDMVTKRNDGYEVTFGSERANDAVERLCTLIHVNEGAYPALHNAEHEELLATGGGNYASRIFIEGRSAFSAGLVQDAATIIPSIDFSCGIIPYPKWDEEQAEYRSMLQRNCYFTIPSSCKNVDMSGAVLEAWSSLAHRTLQPEYFEVSLKVRYTEGEAMARMFDLLRNSLNFDIGEIFVSALGTPSGEFKDKIRDNDTSWASLIASKKDGWQATLDNIYDSFR
ncbi:MAG: hypothetical protein HFE63_07830 [Clostridiales bacterium]|nr:hypothetical protein [Clostridiales bacterium]